MNLVFTEITNSTGNINKRYDKAGKKHAAAAVYKATGKTMEMPVSDFQQYLEDLNSQPSKAIILGGSGLDKFEVRKKGKEDIEKGIISRTKKYFDYVNSDSVGIMLFDVDGNSDHGPWSEDEVGNFIGMVEKVLSGCIIGIDGKSRKTLQRWIKHSSSAGIRGSDKSSLHVFFPCRNANSRIIELLYKLAWLNEWKSHLVTKAGIVLPRTVIDDAVKSPERLVFESDCTIDEGCGMELDVRECDYVPGGVLDSELALIQLGDMGLDELYEIEKKDYVARISATPEVVKVRGEYDKVAVEKLLKKDGMSKSAAKKAVKSRRNGILLSSDYLIKDDMTEVQIYDVLRDPDLWNGKDGFRHPMEPEYGENKCKIFDNGDNVVLNSFAHGGVLFEMKFDSAGLLLWLDNEEKLSEEDFVDEIEDNHEEYLLQSELTSAQLNKISGIIAKKLGGTKADIKKDVQAAKTEVKKAKVVGAVDDDATHGQISANILNKFGDYKMFAGELYVFDKTLWSKRDNGNMLKTVAVRYQHCALCRTGSQYTQIVKHTLATAENRIDQWRAAEGFPCSNKFWKVDIEGKSVEQVDYSKELGARFKLPFEPDFEMKTPNWDSIMRNVENPECLQKGLGLAMCGVLNSHLQQLLTMKGPGGVGKGTVQKVMMAMLPRGRVTTLSFGMMNIIERLGVLKDSVVNFIPEVKKAGSNDKPINMTGLKMLTGGDLVMARDLFKDSFDFISPASHIVSMNTWPRLDTFSSEIERRFSGFLVEFKHNHEDKIDRLDEAVIEHELPGVLAWLINGVRLWIKEGNEDKHSVRLFKSWAQSVDTVESFLLDKCRFGVKLMVLRAGLWDNYQQYCQSGNLNPIERNAFYAQVLEYKTVQDHRKNDGRYFAGLELEI